MGELPRLEGPCREVGLAGRWTRRQSDSRKGEAKRQNPGFREKAREVGFAKKSR